MDRNILQKLIEWRNRCALKEGVEVYRVLPTQAIKEIAVIKPKSKEELTAIKGIKEKKFEKYGLEILAIVNENEEKSEVLNKKENQNLIYSVGSYLTFLNNILYKHQARIQGEISSLDLRENYLFFSLKDKDDKSLLNCFMWMSAYQICGVVLEEGMEIIVEGFPEIHKPSGRLSFKASSVELVGEGALKKAYDELKKKLQKEGLFSEERKKPIPEFPEHIGVITSKTGAAIGDFLANIGKFGFKISLLDSRVEGQLATRELLKSIQTFRKKQKEIDVLVIMRGGGSLESLLPFNNEMLVRAIAEFPLPVIAGIGHEKDISLAAMTADKMVSTPTAAAKLLNESWERATYKIEHNQKRILSIFERILTERRVSLNLSLEIMKDSFRLIFEKFRQAEESLKQSFVSLGERLFEINRNLLEYTNAIFNGFKNQTKEVRFLIDSSEKLLATHNPEHQLNLGYAIVRSAKSIVRDINQIKENQAVNVRIKGGDFDSKVIKINK